MAVRVSENITREAEQERSTAGIAEVARYLQNALGQKTVAYLAGIRDPKMVGRWARGKNKPAELPQLRLRATFELTKIIVAAYDAETAKAWLFGSNSRLENEAPAYLARHAESWDDLRLLIQTARAFAGGES